MIDYEPLCNVYRRMLMYNMYRCIPLYSMTDFTIIISMIITSTNVQKITMYTPSLLTLKFSMVTASELRTSTSIVSSSRSMSCIFSRICWRAASDVRDAKSAPTWPWVSLATTSRSTSSSEREKCLEGKGEREREVLRGEGGWEKRKRDWKTGRWLDLIIITCSGDC